MSKRGDALPLLRYRFLHVATTLRIRGRRRAARSIQAVTGLPNRHSCRGGGEDRPPPVELPLRAGQDRMYLVRYHDIEISRSGVWRILKRLDTGGGDSPSRRNRPVYVPFGEDTWFLFQRLFSPHATPPAAILFSGTGAESPRDEVPESSALCSRGTDSAELQNARHELQFGLTQHSTQRTRLIWGKSLPWVATRFALPRVLVSSVPRLRGSTSTSRPCFTDLVESG